MTQKVVGWLVFCNDFCVFLPGKLVRSWIFWAGRDFANSVHDVWDITITSNQPGRPVANVLPAFRPSWLHAKRFGVHSALLEPTGDLPRRLHTWQHAKSTTGECYMCGIYESTEMNVHIGIALLLLASSPSRGGGVRVAEWKEVLLDLLPFVLL